MTKMRVILVLGGSTHAVMCVLFGIGVAIIWCRLSVTAKEEKKKEESEESDDDMGFGLFD